MSKRAEVKRVARANVILDNDDYSLLKILKENNVIYDNQPEKLYSLGLSYNKLKESLNISHNSLLLHLRRLSKYKLIVVIKTADPSVRFLGNQIFGVFITLNGMEVIELFKEPKPTK